MRPTSSLIAAATAAALLLVPPPARAEVSAEVDAFGTYIRTVVQANASSRNVKVWTVNRAQATLVPLNPDGDLRGDLWPEILENPLTGSRPWVVWSRFDGRQYDLAWSRWSAGGWTAPVPLSLEPAGDDLDPALAVDANGMVWTAWWRNENGRGRVYLSGFLSTRWMSPYPVSDEGVDSKDVTLEVLPDGTLRVTYLTPGGPIVRLVKFARPATITDDINPLGALSKRSEGDSLSSN